MGVPSVEERQRRPRRDPADWVFLVSLVVAVPAIRYAQRSQWFSGDEWALVLDKHLTDPESMVTLQNGHITTLPAILFRLLYNVVGLHHYWPYQALAIGTHLGVVVLLRLVMVRAGVDRWIATVAVSVVLFFGSGNQNMGTAFQITLTGALAFGLLMLLATDHDGRVGRRDALGVLAGLAAVMCSGAALPMLGAVGLTVWIRRGLPTAVAIVAIPATTFFVWNALAPRDGPALPRGGVASSIRFARALLLDTFDALGRSWLVGLALIAVLTVGWALVARAVRSGTLALTDVAPPGALLATGIGMALTIGVARSATDPWGTAPTSLERYLYLVAALSMPGLAVAMSACADRWRVARPASVALLLICLAGNAPRLGLSPSNAEVGDEAMLLQIADLAVSMDPPGDMRVLLTRGSGIRLTVGALRDARIAGDVPDPLEGTEEQRRRAFLLLLLVPSDDLRRAGCTPVEPGETTTVERGDRLVLDGPSPVEIRRVVDGVTGDEAHVPLTLFSPYAVRISTGPVDLVTAHPPDTTVVHCRSG